MTPATPSLVAVIIPAHNEERRIAHSLWGIERAAAHPLLRGCTVLPVVVLDDCEDDTARCVQIARTRLRGGAIEARYRNVGASRKAGIDYVLRYAKGQRRDHIWIATTDADSVVDRSWLIRQLAWWRRGAGAIAGTVRPYASQRSPRRFARYDAYMNELGLDFGHPHVHGANMAFTAETYLEAGGIESLPTAEDHALWKSMCGTGRPTWSVGDVVVTTSARDEGRAPNGFAGFLRTFEGSAQDGLR